MPFFDTRIELESFDSLPLLCVECGFQSEIQRPDPAVLDALYDVSSLHQFEYELTMLERTKSFFARFPNSRHPQKMCKEFANKEERPKMEADPELDRALEADPELKSFLRRSFWLPGRTQFVTQAIERCGEPDVRLITCTSCERGHFRIDPDFFDNIYIYIGRPEITARLRSRS